MKNRTDFFKGLVLPVVTVFVLMSSCKKTSSDRAAAGPDVNFYAVTQDNRLLLYNGQNTAIAKETIAITGLQSAEHIAGIDFRPNTGQLFAVGTSSRIYSINIKTGAAFQVGSTTFSPTLTGTTAGFDFNPTVDRIRLVSGAGQNLRLNPENGTVAATDGNINGATGASITASAYTQSRAGATSTVLYGIDIVNNKLYKQDPPNAGTLVEVGALNIDVESTGGFDISADSAYALAVLTVGGKAGLYTINLQTGAAEKAGDFNETITGIAIPTFPVAYAVSASNQLLVLNPATGDIQFTKTITGLQTNENILGTDMRPATGQLYALGSSSRLYTIAVSSGVATQAGTGTFSTALNGTSFGFDFNPTVDRIRLISNAGQNLRLNPIDGTVAAVDGNINPSSAMLSAAAYTNNFAGATTTTLFDIDTQTGRLVKQDPPNAGTVSDIGSLGITVEASNGFDIGGTSGLAWAILTVNGTTRIYNINLTTGAATGGAAISQPVNGFTLGLGL